MSEMCPSRVFVMRFRIASRYSLSIDFDGNGTLAGKNSLLFILRLLPQLVLHVSSLISGIGRGITVVDSGRRRRRC